MLAFWIAATGTSLTAQGQTSTTAGGYTLTKILDTNTLIPDESGQKFAYLFQSSNQIYVTDGSNVAFTFYEHVNSGAGGTPTDTDIWAVSASGGTPIRLVDTTMAAPGGNGALFSDLSVQGIGGGMVVFAGIYPIPGSYSNGSGLYAVPVGGGAITTLVSTTTPVPNNPTATFGFSTGRGAVTVHGSQVLFASGGGLYFVPVTGGTLTRFGDAGTPLVDPAGMEFIPKGYSGGNQQADFGGGTVSFVATGANSSSSGDLFAAPATGLTLDGNGIVNNAEFLAGQSTLVPDTSTVGFSPYEYAAYMDDSGTPVFEGATSIGAPEGLYASLNGALTVLANSKTIATNGDNTATLFAFALAVGGGKAYFEADGTAKSGYSTQGIYSVPVTGGPVAPVVTAADSVPGVSGAVFASGSFTFTGGLSGGKLVFIAAYPNPAGSGVVTGLYLATPGSGGSVAPSNELILNNHVGGNTGPVTLTATLIPGAPALVSGATVKLSATGLSDIAGDSVVVNATGTALNVTIDLKKQALGTYDFVVTNPDGTTITQTAAFTVEAGTGPNVYGDLIGRYLLRAGKAQSYTLVVGNSGDVDAAMVPVFLSVPSVFQVQVVSKLLTPPQPGGVSSAFDFTQVPQTYANGDQTVLPLIIGRVPAGSLATVQILLTVPDVPQYAHASFNLNVAVGEPFLDAATSAPPTDAVRAVHLADGGRHPEAVGGFSTCLASLFNVVLDCGGLINPALGELEGVDKCVASSILYLEGSYANLGSDNADPSYGAYEGGQVIAGGVGTVLTCAGALPGVNTIVNAINCGIDTYLLYDNCIRPNIVVPIQTIVSGDPNDLDGSIGDGSAAHYLTGTQPLRYLVSFENEPTASAPAQSVTITNPLDANLDLSTFSLGPISFGSTLISPPTGAQNYTTVVDLRPATNLLVQVTATLNTASRTFTATFQSLDPATNQPPTDPTAGFLPPDLNAPAGDGFVIYYAKPKAGLATGTTVNDQASIVFDVNAPIVTPVWTNTIDNAAPASHLAALPVKLKTAAIPLQLTGTDTGSGVKFFNVYVSEDGGKFQPLVKNAIGSTVTYNGVTGHVYTFFSQAVDAAGNVEPLKTAGEAQTKIRGADLTGSWQAALVEKVGANGRSKLKQGVFAVTNQSTQKPTAAGSLVRFYLSADGSFETSDPVIGADLPFGVLAPGGSVTLPLGTLKLPVGTAASGMYVVAVIDPDHAVPDTDYSNNVVVYGPLP